MLSLVRQAQMRGVEPVPPDWQAAFGNQAPVEVDLGCGRGVYALERATRFPGVNVVALEVRKKWLVQLRARARRQGVLNLRAVRCDVSEDLPMLFAPATVSGFTIHHPDPWWKKRHRKRRLVRPSLVEVLVHLLRPGGWIFAQTDVPDLADEMQSVLAACDRLTAVDPVAHQRTCLGGIRSHRESKCRQAGIPVRSVACVLDRLHPDTP